VKNGADYFQKKQSAPGLTGAGVFRARRKTRGDFWESERYRKELSFSGTGRPGPHQSPPKPGGWPALRVTGQPGAGERWAGSWVQRGREIALVEHFGKTIDPGNRRGAG